ncbi:hypothetical protein ACHHYP_09101 [Achlya hypogyna]|uniref:SP-RING-type domain-containing protein n=1 Tax=Achlya hypogyna TaxID=1202772 RepID=A0A1V9YNQ9_ACHHY|nr:hypothetical protein ACHHYP_09101 [Achlya hypogyna]
MAGRSGKRKAMVVDSDDDEGYLQPGGGESDEGDEGVVEAPAMVIKTPAQWLQEIDEEVKATLPEALGVCVSNAKRQRHDLLKRVIEGSSAVCGIAAMVKEHGNETQMTALKELTTDFITLHGRIGAYEKNLESLGRKLATRAIPKNFAGSLKVGAIHISDADVARHEYYKRFCNAAGIEDEDEDADVLVQETETARSFACPITLLDMEHPLRNTPCGHTYSKEGITAHLKRSNKCPIGGCQHKVALETLERDVDMEVRIASHRNHADLNNTTAFLAADDEDDDEIAEHNVE